MYFTYRYLIYHMSYIRNTYETCAFSLSPCTNHLGGVNRITPKLFLTLSKSGNIDLRQANVETSLTRGGSLHCANLDFMKLVRILALGIIVCVSCF